MNAPRRLVGLGLALVGGALAAGSAPASAQIGALAAAAAAAGAGGEYALAGAPVFSESGLVLDQGWSAGAFGVTTSTSTSAFDGFGEVDVDFSVSNLAMGAFAAVGDRAMVGAVLNPYVSAEISSGGRSETATGLGNLTAFGKIALATSGPTRLAGTLSVELPVGDEEVASRTRTISAGLGVSHRIDATTSLHGGFSVGVTGDDGDTETFDEGGTGFGFDAAVVKQLSPRAWLSGELLGSSFDGAWQVLLAPGARFRAGERVFIDVGVAFGGLSSDDVEPIDYGLAVGATFVPRR